MKPSISLTENQCERIGDKLRAAGFNFEDIVDNETFALIAECVLEALEIEFDK